MKRPLTHNLLQQMIDSTCPTLERMLSMPILTQAEWQMQEDNEGVWLLVIPDEAAGACR